MTNVWLPSKEEMEVKVIDEILAQRRKANGLQFYTPNEHQLKAHQSNARFVLLVGGNRIGKCVTLNTKIDTPSGEIPMKELYEAGKPFKVYAWDGRKKVVVNASAPFKKDGRHKCYRIEMSDGRFIEVADHHRILSSTGHWIHADVYAELFSGSHLSALNSQAKVLDCGLHVKSSASHQATTSDICQSVHGEDVHRCGRIEQGCLDGCLEDPHQCDGQPLYVQDNDRVSSPSQDDARKHILCSSYSDDQENRYTDTLSQSELRLSIQYGRFQNEDQFAETLSQTSYTTCLLFDGQFPSAYPQQRVSCLFPRSFYEAPVPFDSPLLIDGNNIVSFNIIGYQEVYDFEVNTYHNYFAGGLINHNSTAGAVELCMHLTRQYPDWWSVKRRFDKPIKAIVVGESNSFIEKVLEPKLKQYLPPRFIRHEKRVTGGYLNRIECKDGSVVDFLTKEQADMAFEGADWDFYWGDEPQSKRKFDAIQRGLVDRKGFGIVTFTPLIEPWMKEELVDKADGVFVEVITATIYDNIADIKGNAILSKESIDEWKRTLSEDVAQTRIHGKFFHLRGTVYSEFGEIHQQRFPYNYPDPVICILDPHDRKPHHVIWAVVTPDDDLYIHTELSQVCTVEELAKSILRIEKNMMSQQTGPDGKKLDVRTGYRMRRRLIDPNFGRKPLITTGRNMIEELARAGCPGWAEADDPVDEGHLKVKDYLHYDFSQPISLTNKPKLYFHKDRCPITVRQMRSYQYAEWVGKTAEERDPKEAPKDKNSDGPDCIRYLCMSNPHYRRESERHDYELSEPAY